MVSPVGPMPPLSGQEQVAGQDDWRRRRQRSCHQLTERRPRMKCRISVGGYHLPGSIQANQVSSTGAGDNEKTFPRPLSVRSPSGSASLHSLADVSLSVGLGGILEDSTRPRERLGRPFTVELSIVVRELAEVPKAM